MKHSLYNTNLSRSKGFSLVELMVAMLLGLVLVGAATGVMLSNMQSFSATKDMAQMQDGARLGFELMARDIRQAGSIPCGYDAAVPNVPDTTAWYLNWHTGIKGQLIGYSSGTPPVGLTNIVEGGSEVLTVLYADNTGANVISSTATSLTFDSTNNRLATGDYLFICDANNASIFKANINANKVTVNAGPENNIALGVFTKNTVVSKLKSRAWYIGKNDQEGHSLYLAELTSSGLQHIEIASGVNKLTLEYRSNEDMKFKAVSAITQWSDVNVVKITLELHDATNSKNERTFSSIVAVRNRIQ